MAVFCREYLSLRQRCPDAAQKADLIAGLHELLARAGFEGAEPWRLFFAARLAAEEGRLEEALAAYDDLPRRFGASTDADEQSAVAMGLINKGCALRKQGRPAEEILVYDDAIRRFEGASDPELRRQVARAFVNKGLALGNLDRPKDEIACYDEVVKRFGAEEAPELRKQVALALVRKGMALGDLKQPAGEIGAYDEVVRRFGESDVPELRAQAARALFNKAAALGQLRGPAEEIAACDEVVRWSDRTPEDPDLRRLAARSLVRKAVALDRLGRTKDEIAAYEEVLRRFGDAEDLELLRQAAWALFSNGVAFAELRKPARAIAVYDELVLRFGDRADPELRVQTAGALINKGIALGELGRPEEELAAYDEVVRRFGEADDPKLRRQVARALLNRGVALGQNARPADQVAACDEIVRRFRDTDDPELRRQVARALMAKGVALRSLGCPQDARDALVASASFAAGDESIEQRVAILLNTLDSLEPTDILTLLDEIMAAFPARKQKRFLGAMRSHEQRMKDFLSPTGRFPSGPGSPSILLVLREWNSFTPSVPDQHEIARGGGYFIRYGGQGIVIDPGFDFIRNFDAAGGRVCDIDHIIITHAHNDHTQDFESLLSLFHQYNRRNRAAPKRVHLYLSLGAARKFSGYLPLRDVPDIAGIEILNHGSRENPQVIRLHGLEGARLTVLRAFHDDVVTLDCSVGLGFEFDFGGLTRTVVFTGDTGLFPPKRDEAGNVLRDRDGAIVLDIDPRAGSALHNQYPDAFRRPNLLVPHIGSIKENEFRPERPTGADSADPCASPYFYPDHLGLRGLVMLLDQLQPEVAIISEFGEELKSIRFDLARGIGRLLAKRHKDRHPNGFVLPGDLTIVYDIGAGTFLCHDTRDFRPPSGIGFLEVEEPENSRFYCKDIKRTYVFSRPVLSGLQALNKVRHYHVDVEDAGPPYCVR